MSKKASSSTVETEVTEETTTESTVTESTTTETTTTETTTTAETGEPTTAETTKTETTTTKKKKEKKMGVVRYLNDNEQPYWVALIMKDENPLCFKTKAEWDAIAEEIRTRQYTTKK